MSQFVVRLKLNDCSLADAPRDLAWIEQNATSLALEREISAIRAELNTKMTIPSFNIEPMTLIRPSSPPKPATTAEDKRFPVRMQVNV